MKPITITTSCALLASCANAFTIPAPSVQQRVSSHAFSSSLNMVIDPSDLINNMASSFSSNILADVADVADVASVVDTVDVTSVADAATASADAVSQPSYSKVSYYTTLGLYIMSFPGLWSQIKRSTTAKLKRKTYLR